MFDMQKNNSLKKIAIIGFLISFIIILFFSNIVSFLSDFVENYLSSDNSISPNTIIRIKTLVITLVLVFITTSILIIPNVRRKIIQVLNTYFQTDKAQKLFLTDDLCRKDRLSLYTLIAGTFLGFILHFYLLLLTGIRYEGPMEKLTAFLFPISSIALIISIVRIKKISIPSKKRKTILLILTAFSVIFLLILGEEISWGQRIFGWESYGVFKDYNLQKETNLHNFFLNPIYPYIYPFVGMSSFLVLLFFWVFKKNENSSLYDLFFPHPSLFFLSFIMACSSFRGENEAFETLLAIFIFLYSFRIFMYSIFPTKKLVDLLEN